VPAKCTALRAVGYTLVAPARWPQAPTGCYASRAMKHSEKTGSASELIFLVEQAPEGGFTARALGETIFTEADGPADLHDKVRDAVRCHFDEAQLPKIIRLHFVREEVITA
jgi:hypothetical protein